MATPDRLPYYAGPSDPGALRDYLNMIIRVLNALIAYVESQVVPVLPLAVNQGGTGATTAAGARANLGAAASGDNQDITALSGLIYRAVTGNTSVALTDQVIEVDATAGNVIVTYPLALVAVGKAKTVRINKTDTTANLVEISDGTTVQDAISTPASAGGQIGGWRDVYSNGTNLRSAGVG